MKQTPTHLALAFSASLLISTECVAAPQCPLSYGTTDDAKSEKLFLYFPTSADSTFPTFPSHDANFSPARAFDVADLNPAIGTTAALIDRIHDVVSDDYCEFNVQVLATTSNPAILPVPPARRATVAIGSDNSASGGWGQARAVDTGDAVDIDFARVWAGIYTTCEGGNELTPSCTTTGALTGANATLDGWAQAIGGTAAHEAGHTYGLAHTDDDPATGSCGEFGTGPLPGEDSYHRHLMPNGCRLSGDDRATFRRHLSDRTFGLLATNVGLSIQTMHNWDLKNPNAANAYSLAIDFLSPLAAVPISWSYAGTSSPWINPAVTGPSGTSVFKSKTYNKFRITWSTPNPSWVGSSPGIVPGGAEFHIGTTFTGVDFNKPDPIIIQDVTLFDAGSSALTLHPRLPLYDAGTLDSASDTFSVQFFSPELGIQLLQLQNAVVFQLPRPASIDSLTGTGRPFTFDGREIVPWVISQSQCTPGPLPRAGSSSFDQRTCVLAALSDPAHVSQVFMVGQPGVFDCSNGVPRITTDGHSVTRDSVFAPDFEGPICAGASRDPFPSTTVYIRAVFVDPDALHFDPQQNQYVTGPVTSTVFYQFAGVRDIGKALLPQMCDVDENGVIDIDDIAAILAARNTRATPGDPRDADGDGIITVNDARICVNRCTNAHCAP